LTKIGLVGARKNKATDERRWRITIVVTLVVAGVAGAIGVAMTDSPPKLQYRVEDKIVGPIHHITVTMQNSGIGPSMNPSGWVEFPAGEEPQFASGGLYRFEVQVGEEWKQLGRKWTALRSSRPRVRFRANQIQPGSSYELHFYAKRVRPTSDSVKVHLGDDSGLADRVQSW